MRRTTIALLAALEASVAALIGLGIVHVPLMLLWAMHFELAVDAGVFLRTSADVWLLVGDNAYESGSAQQYQAQFFAPFRSRLRSS